MRERAVNFSSSVACQVLIKGSSEEGKKGKKKNGTQPFAQRVFFSPSAIFRKSTISSRKLVTYIG